MNKMRQWAVLTAVACFAVVAAGWMVAVKPQRSHASSLKATAAGVRSDNDRLVSQVNQLKQQQKDLPAQQKQLAAIATKIPDNPALPALIRQLSAAADDAGVNLVALNPSMPAPALAAAVAAPVKAAPAAASTTGSAAAPAVHAAPVTPLDQIPIALQVRGSYFNLEQFFSAVESLSRAMLVTGFTITPAGGGAAAASTGSGAPAASTVPADTLNAQINAMVFESTTVQPSTTTPVH